MSFDQCPRCNGEWTKHSWTELECGVDYWICECGMVHYPDREPYDPKNDVILRMDLQYHLEWRGANTMHIETHMFHPSHPPPRTIAWLDHWLPFNITEEQLELYLTFS